MRANLLKPDTIRVIELEVARMVQQLPLDPFMQSLSIHVLERGILEFQAGIAYQDLGSPSKTVNVTVPKNWFQAFKRDCFPKFLLKRFPVIETTIPVTLTVDVTALFPNIPCDLHKGRILYKISSPRIDISKFENDYAESMLCINKGFE